MNDKLYEKILEFFLEKGITKSARSFVYGPCSLIISAEMLIINLLRIDDQAYKWTLTIVNNDKIEHVQGTPEQFLENLVRIKIVKFDDFKINDVS